MSNLRLSTPYTMWAAGGIVLSWIAVHGVYANKLLLHDSWIHIFPFLFSVSRDVTCAGMPQWLSMVDSGSPHLIHVISSSITHLLRLPFLYAMGCLQLDVIPALYLHKLQIYLSYMVLAAGTYVLGIVLYRNRASALYLLAATLFTGLCLDSAHSDQVVSLLFWTPWIAICLILYQRHRGSRAGGWYLNGAVLFICVQALDQYPHFIALAVVVALIVFLAFERSRALRSLPSDMRYVAPAVVVIAFTGFQLLAVKAGITEYRPSFRSELLVHPSTFGETGFAQPTALIGSFFPLAMLRVHDELANGLGAWLATQGVSGVRGFMYRYDVLFFHLGVIPLFLCVAAVVSPQERRLNLGWFAFAACMFLVALQQSKLYFLLHYLPFFDVFRSYGLYLSYAAFSLLVLSGLGFNALITSAPGDRVRVVRQTTVVIGLLSAFALACIIALLYLAPETRATLRALRGYFIVDALLLLAGIWAARSFVSYRNFDAVALAKLLAVLIVAQGIYAAGVYQILGTNVAAAMHRMGLDPEDRQSLPAGPISPDRYTRKECRLFTQCYLSLRPAASLRLDLEGSFLRSRNSVIYEEGIDSRVIAALAGISHPVVWPSQKLERYTNRKEMAAAMTASATSIGPLLQTVTFVHANDAPEASMTQLSSSNPVIVSVERRQDALVVAYTSDSPFYLNASVTYDTNWTAHVSGSRLKVYRGNFDGLLVGAPAGNNILEFRYSSWRSKWFFLSRYVLLTMALVAVVALLAAIVSSIESTWSPQR